MKIFPPVLLAGFEEIFKASLCNFKPTSNFFPYLMLCLSRVVKENFTCFHSNKEATLLVSTIHLYHLSYSTTPISIEVLLGDLQIYLP